MKNTFLQLMKDSNKQSKFNLQYKLAVLGDCATQHLSMALRGYGYEQKISIEVFQAEYNQITSEILDDQSNLYKFTPDGVLIQMCSEKLYEEFCKAPTNQRSNFAKATLDKIEGYWQGLSSKRKMSIMQFNFAENNDMVFGNFGASLEQSYIFQLRKLNFLMQELALTYKNVSIIDIQSIQVKYGRDVFFDEASYYSSKIPISLVALPQVCAQVVQVIQAMLGRVKKCIVLDLDNTLWGGVIGDDGMGGIQIGELGIGHAFTEFQMWLKELKRRGILLAVCSKNNEDTAKEPFEHHPEMVLHLEDFSIFVANWNNKASNIQFIQQTLNIGMDSIVFIDDNPFERDVVKSIIPDITVPDMPVDPAKYISFLKELNLFETASYSAADEQRTQQYRAQADRAITLEQYSDYNQYLQSLDMRAVCHSFDEFNFARISQLSQRSNQFNLRTVRYTQSEVETISKDSNYITLYFTLEDKFGAYGLISAVILKKIHSDELFIENWFMSCRVLKRGVEEFILNKVVQCADQENIPLVVGEYIPTEKNKMVEDIYDKHGFVSRGNGTFTLEVAQYTPGINYISEVKYEK